jgi:hypothetical protein
MRVLPVAALVIFALPLLGAQRARAGRVPVRLERQQPSEGVPISGKDIDRMTPARVILERREPLKLEKAQVSRLDSLARVFGDSAKRLADSVRKYQRAVTTAPPMLKRPPEGKPETKKDSVKRADLERDNRAKRDKYFETVTAGRRDLAAALLALKELFDTSLAATIQALDGAQHTAAALALEQTSDEFTRRLRLANVR